MSTDKSAAAIREFAEKWCLKVIEVMKGDDYIMHDLDGCLSDLTALIEEHYYPKEFVEWVFREGIGSNDDGTLFHYVSIQIKGHPFKETKELTYNTTDELFNYWKENEQC